MSEHIVVVDTETGRPACVLLQAVMGGGRLRYRHAALRSTALDHRQPTTDVTLFQGDYRRSAGACCEARSEVPADVWGGREKSMSREFTERLRSTAASALAVSNHDAVLELALLAGLAADKIDEQETTIRSTAEGLSELREMVRVPPGGVGEPS